MESELSPHWIYKDFVLQGILFNSSEVVLCLVIFKSQQASFARVSKSLLSRVQVISEVFICFFHLYTNVDTACVNKVYSLR